MKKNKYINRSRISEAKFRELLFAFSIDLITTQIRQLTKLNRNTVNQILQKIIIRLAQICEASTPFKGTIELDESYFGPKRQKGKKDEELLTKQSFLVFTSVMELFVHKLLKIFPKRFCKK